jgi:hypothetical protein
MEGNIPKHKEVAPHTHLVTVIPVLSHECTVKRKL